MLAAPWLGSANPVDADTTVAAVGACVVGLTVGGIGPIPATTATVSVTGSGLCVVNGDVTSTPPATITISGSLTSDVPTWTCVGGAAVGQLTFTVAHPKSLSSMSATIGFVVGGAGASMVVGRETLNPAFAGAGAFVRDVGSLTSCAAPGASMTFCGAFTFVRGNPGPPI